MQLQLRELVAHDLSDHLALEAACCEHVGLVEAPDRRGRVTREGEVGGEARDAFDLRARVRLCVEGRPIDLRSPN
jgi:hypothetical protein